MDERLTRRAAYSSDKRELLKLLLQRTAHKFNAFALSSAQQRLWFLDQFQPNSPLYHLPAAVHLNGPLDLPALAQSLQALVQRHEALRTRFMVVADQPLQIVAPDLRVPLPVLDLRALPAATREGAAQHLAQEQAQRPFDLVRGPLLRTTLLRLEADAHVLLLSMHHLIADGWSLGIVVRDLTALYTAAVAGRPTALPDLPIQYADFAAWQRAWLQGSGVRGQGTGDRGQGTGEHGDTETRRRLETPSPTPNTQHPTPIQAQLAYWQTQLAGAPTVLALPTDHPRPATPTLRGARLPLALPERLAAGLAALSRREGATLFMTLLAAFQLLLARYTDQEDLLVGTPVANRTRAATEQVIGCFVNTLVLRGDLSGNPTFRELVRRVRMVCLDAYAHQDLPFEHLVQVLQPERDLRHMPLVQVLFVLQNAPLPPLALAGLNVRLQELDTGTAKFDLTINLAEQAEGLVGWLEYATDLFEAATVARLAGHWQTLLEGVVADADRRVAELPLLTAAERQQVLVEWNTAWTGVRSQESGVRSEAPHSWLPASDSLCIHHLFEAQVARTPDAVAIVFDERSSTNDHRPPTNDERRRTKNQEPRTKNQEPRADDHATTQNSKLKTQNFSSNTQHPTPNTQHLTYRELNVRANRLAHHLRALGVGPEVPVAICMERSPQLLIGLLSVLKAGGAYVPLDPTYPAERLAFMLEDAQVPVLITTNDQRPTTNDQRPKIEDGRSKIEDRRSPAFHPRSSILDPQSPIPIDLRADWPMIALAPATDPSSAASPDNLAYLIYTSGSTGRPKGVAITHRSAGALIAWAGAVFTPAELRGVLAATSISFDLSVFELFVPWSYGGCVILAEQALLLDQLRSAAAVTLVNTVPSVLREVLRLGALPSSVRVVNLAGEPLDAALARQVYAQPQVARLLNLYGPSEDTTYSTYSCVPRDVDTPPAIGRPISHTQVYLLDRWLQPAPVGVVGELYLGGLGLARGYLNRPDLTAAAFIPNPFVGDKETRRQGDKETEDRRSKIEDRGSTIFHPPSSIIDPRGERLYRTGDLARYRPDGAIEYLGRADQQVKIRGFRIELGEIEAALSQHPDIRDAVVVAHEERAGGKRLVAYVVPKIEDRGLKIEDSGSSAPEPLSSILYPLSSELRAFLKEQLPEYMIPAAFVVLEALPRMPNGKVDRSALPAPAMADLEQATSFVAPRTPQEELLAQIWADVLGLARVGAYDHFFARGGHSLLATQVLARVRETFQVELPLRTLFEAPTLATLAEEIARARRAGPAVAMPPLQPVVRAGALPLAFAQQRLWFIQQLDPRSTAYTIAAAVRLSGALDLWALAQSLQALVQRHEVFRTTFASVEGRPVQRIASTGRVPLPALDLHALPKARRESVAQQLAREQARHPFDLVRGPLLRTTLLRLDAGEHVLLLTMHHIISDGWSLGVLVRELTALYAAIVAGRPAALPDLPIQYADYAVWQRAWLQGSGVRGQGSGARGQRDKETRRQGDKELEAFDSLIPNPQSAIPIPARPLRYACPPSQPAPCATLVPHPSPPPALRLSPIQAQLAYWRTQLRDPLPTLELPSDRPRPAVQTFRGAQQAVMLPAPLSAALAGLGQRTQVTRFMMLLAAFATLLARYTDQEELLVGAPVANRIQRAVEGLIGLFANTLVLRIDLSGNPRFRELLARVREVALEAYAHQDLPFEQLVEALQPARDMSRNPLVQVMFALQEAPLPTQEVAGLRLQAQVIDGGTAQFDLALHLAEREEALVGWFEYNSDLFDAATIARLAGHWRTLLEGVVADPAQRLAGLPLLTAAERQQVLVEWNATRTEFRSQESGVRSAALCIHDLFEAQAVRTPDAVAVVFDGRPPTTDHRPPTTNPSPLHPFTPSPVQQLTYRELNARANRLAHHLRTLGVGPEVPVAICMERSPELLVGLLGVLKAGGAYVPLDPTYPKERLAFMLEDAQAAVLITTTDHRPPTNDQRSPLHPFTPSPLHPFIWSGSVVDLRADWPTIAQASADNPATPVAPQNLAYAIYTSGSTGTPKAVEVPHVGLLNLIAWHQRTYGLTADDRAMQFAGISFDAMCWEIWPYLTIGASLALPGAEVRLTPARLQEWLVAQRITIAFLPTPLAEAAVALTWPEMCTLRALLTGGDQLHHYPTSGLGFTLVNHYGPTEATVVTTAAAVPASPTTEMLPPIGRPIANMQVYVLDRQLQPVPIGIPGELHIGGIGLARGYRNRPELTAAAFIPNPFADQEQRTKNKEQRTDDEPVTQNLKLKTQNLRLYRTGDLVRYLPDGNIQYLGRRDAQVKVRGFRIELGEIEATLRRHPDVRECAVLARADGPGGKRLVAYVVPKIEDRGLKIEDSGSDAPEPLSSIFYPLSSELRGFLRTRLPDYMLPATFMFLDALPLTPSGKIDRRALPEPGDLRSQLEAPYVAPQTAMEQAIAGVWKAVLQVDQVGLHDNFFDLGGHSLLIAQLHSKLQESLGLNISMIDLFTHPTVSAIAQHVHQGQDEPALFQERPALVEARSESLRQRRRLLQTYWETEHNEEDDDE